MAANTSCLLALVKTETAVENRRANINVIDAIDFVDILHVRNTYIGMSRIAVEATAMMILISMPSRVSE